MDMFRNRFVYCTRSVVEEMNIVITSGGWLDPRYMVPLSCTSVAMWNMMNNKEILRLICVRYDLKWEEGMGWRQVFAMFSRYNMTHMSIRYVELKEYQNVPPEFIIYNVLLIDLDNTQRYHLLDDEISRLITVHREYLLGISDLWPHISGVVKIGVQHLIRRCERGDINNRTKDEITKLCYLAGWKEMGDQMVYGGRDSSRVLECTSNKDRAYLIYQVLGGYEDVDCLTDASPGDIIEIMAYGRVDLLEKLATPQLMQDVWDKYMDIYDETINDSRSVELLKYLLDNNNHNAEHISYYISTSNIEMIDYLVTHHDIDPMCSIEHLGSGNSPDDDRAYLEYLEKKEVTLSQIEISMILKFCVQNEHADLLNKYKERYPKEYRCLMDDILTLYAPASRTYVDILLNLTFSVDDDPRYNYKVTKSDEPTSLPDPTPVHIKLDICIFDAIRWSNAALLSHLLPLRRNLTPHIIKNFVIDSGLKCYRCADVILSSISVSANKNAIAKAMNIYGNRPSRIIKYVIAHQGLVPGGPSEHPVLGLGAVIAGACTQSKDLH
jgi:hypothetical protein